MRYTTVAAAADAIIEQTGGEIILGMPLGMGKPNPLANVLYKKASNDAGISLTILTALSLTRPQASGELQQRFLGPFIERVYADYEELDYLLAARKGTLPANVAVHEFFVQPATAVPGSILCTEKYVVDPVLVFIAGINFAKAWGTAEEKSTQHILALI